MREDRLFGFETPMIILGGLLVSNVGLGGPHGMTMLLVVVMAMVSVFHAVSWVIDRIDESRTD